MIIAKKENIEIIAEIPFEKEIAQIYSKGDIITKHEKYEEIFKNMGKKVMEIINKLN